MVSYYDRQGSIADLARSIGVSCEACKGSGDAPPSFDGCWECKGAGRVLPKVITLCGSTRFKVAWRHWNARLTLQVPALVFSVAMWSHDERVEPSPTQKELLDLVHKAKIARSDAIFVLDVGGYIGSSTKGEIEFASSIGVPAIYLNSLFPGWVEEEFDPLAGYPVVVVKRA